MGELNPKGVPFVLGGTERHLLFTLNAIDEIQGCFGLPLGEAMEKLIDTESANGALKTILTILVNDEVERLSYQGGKCSLEAVDEKEVGWMLTNENMTDAFMAVLHAYEYGMPKSDGEDPNHPGRQQNG